MLPLSIAMMAAVRGLARAPRSARMLAFDGIGRSDVCVLGGGFGGLYTALRLASLEWTSVSKPRVRLVDRNERVAFLPMMYELTTGTASCWEVAPTYEEARCHRPDATSLHGPETSVGGTVGVECFWAGLEVASSRKSMVVAFSRRIVAFTWLHSHHSH